MLFWESEECVNSLSSLGQSFSLFRKVISISFISSPDTNALSAEYFDFRNLYKHSIPSSSPTRLTADYSNIYFSAQPFHPFNLDGYAVHTASFNYDFELTGYQQSGCALGFEVWFSHSGGQA